MSQQDPLAPYRRNPQPADNSQASQSLTEHQALKLAIEVLNEVPNHRLRSHAYANTYQLLPVLEEAYRNGQEAEKLTALAPQMYDTLLLCEDALTELGRTNDGTPSIQALMDIQVIKKEAGSIPQAQVEKNQSAAKAFNMQASLSERYTERESERDIEPEV